MPAPSHVKSLILVLGICLISLPQGRAQSAILYQDIVTRDYFKVGLGSYGRIGAQWNFVNGGSIGRRLQLNNMGSIGGRLEEQDYLEIGMGMQMRPFREMDSTRINLQIRASAFSRSLSLFANSNTASEGGLTFALPEVYAEVKDVFVPDLNIWIGARLYRGPDIHIADHWYFNDHAGQGFGVEYKGSRFAANFVSSSDTSSNVPPYFYINIKTGTPSLELRERLVLVYEQDFWIKKGNMLNLLVEYHHMADPGNQIDTVDFTNYYPGDFGWVLGLRHQIQEIKGFRPGSFNQLSLRYGARLANGGDGGSSRTWETFGAPNFNTNSFKNAYSLAIVDHLLLNISQKFSLNSYLIYTQSKGAADTKDKAPTYFDREVFNRKEDFTVGAMGLIYLNDIFHLRTEVHYQQRKDGTQDWYRMLKFSLAPTIAPRGERSVWSRPHLRFAFSLSRYNDLARDHLYSPYLELNGPSRWGYFFGVRAEWWTW